MGQRACRTRSGKFATESRPGDVPCCEGTERLDGFGAALRGRAGLGHLRRLEQQHGRGTAAYYRAVRKAVVDRDVAPSVVVGGGYKNARKAALDWLDDALARANRPGRWRWQGFDGMVPCRDCGTGRFRTERQDARHLPFCQEGGRGRFSQQTLLSGFGSFFGG